MQGAADAKRALKAISANADAIISSFLNRGFSESEDDLKAIAALNKHRLITRIEDDESVRLRNVVVRLLNHCMGRARQESADAHIAGQWKDLGEKFEHYHTASKLGAYDDMHNLEYDIQDMFAELVEDINNSTSQFTRFISTGFAHVSNLTLRIKVNEQALDQATRLNDVLESFNIKDLASYARGNDFLTRLLLKVFPKHLEMAGKNLSYALITLASRLVQLKKDVGLTNLVISFEQKLLQEHNFYPALSEYKIDRSTSLLFPVAPVTMSCHPDTEVASDYQTFHLAQIISQLPRREHKEKTTYEPTTVEMNIHEVIEEISQDEIDHALTEMIEYVISSKSPVRGSGVINALNLDITYQEFAALIAGHVNGLRSTVGDKVRYEFIGRYHDTYKDVLIARDIELSYAGK